MSEQYKAALIRALVIAMASAASTVLITLATTSDVKVLLTAAGTAFFASFAARFGGEGAYDTHRAQTGDVQPSDVSAQLVRPAAQV